jgi:hypothetical protein
MTQNLSALFSFAFLPKTFSFSLAVLKVKEKVLEGQVKNLKKLD